MIPCLEPHYAHISTFDSIGGPLGASYNRVTMTGQETGVAATGESIARETIGRNRIAITGNEVCRLAKKIEDGHLNDELVHFGIKWLTRKSIGREARDKDFISLTSCVYSYLSDFTRPDRFSTAWKASKTDHLFAHKTTSVPIVEVNHWTVCFLVNPTHVGNRVTKSNEFPCMLHFNSLSDKLSALSEKHANDICEWLNHCWMREKKTTAQPFNRESYPVHKINVGLQRNCIDCGLFVCRYVASIYELKHNHFTCGKAGVCTSADAKDETKRKWSWLENSIPFSFSQMDTDSMRVDMIKLVRNLTRACVVHDRFERHSANNPRHNKAKKKLLDECKVIRDGC